MRPAAQHRHRHAIAPPFDPGRKQAEQPARRGLRPHQHGAGIVSEHRQRIQRKRRIVEHVRFQGVHGQRSPGVDDRAEAAERLPLGGEFSVGLPFRLGDTAHAGDDGRRAVERDHHRAVREVGFRRHRRGLLRRIFLFGRVFFTRTGDHFA
jgi:hypothetical protein